MGQSGPLSHPEFRSLWLAGLVSDAGDWLLFIALPIVVYGQTGSAAGTAGAFLAELTPGIILAPIAGQLADRVDRRRVLLIVSALQALSLLPLLLVHGHTGLAIVYGVILVEAALSTLFEPAKNALVPALLGPGMLLRANSLIALNNSLGRLVGGPLGGVLLAVAGLRAVVVADAASFAAAALLLSRVRSSGPVRARTGDLRGRAGRALRGLWRKAPGRGGLGAVMSDARVRAGLLVSFVAEIAQGIFLVLFIVFVARRLHGGSGETGFLRGIQAVGAILGGLVVTSMAPGLSPQRLIAGAAALFGLISLTVWNAPSLTTAPALFAVLFVIVGAPGVVMQTGLISFLQGSGEDAQRGRIFGAFGLVSSAGEAVGIAAAGFLAAPLGLMTLLEAQGLLYLLAAALAGWGLGRRRCPRGLTAAPSR